MKNKFLFGLVMLSVIFSMILFSCGEGAGGGSSNAMSGTWTGTVVGETVSGQRFSSVPATVNISGTKWTFKCSQYSVNENGTCNFLGSVPNQTLETAQFYYNGNIIGGAYVSLDNTLTLSIGFASGFGSFAGIFTK